MADVRAPPPRGSSHAMFTFRSTAALAVTMLVAAVAAMPAAAKVTGPDPLTTGPNYDRNAVVVEDGKDTLVFFARSQGPCNRALGCNPDNGLDAKYDLYMLRVTKKGAGTPQLVAHNPENTTDWRGRTIAA